VPNQILHIIDCHQLGLLRRSKRNYVVMG